MGGGLLVMLFLHTFFGFVAEQSLSVDRGGLLVSLGGSVGYSFFLLFLGLLGFLSLWGQDPRIVVMTVLFGVVFVVSWYVPIMRVLLVPLVAILASVGVSGLLRRQWSVEMIKSVTLFLIALSVLFTLVMTVQFQAQAPPSIVKMQAVRFLQTAPVDEVVLSSAANGVFIERIAHREAFLDDFARGQEVALSRRIVADQLFYSQRLSRTMMLLEEHGITHIFIDPDMTSGQVWVDDEQGLLFLLKNDPRFVKVFDNQGYVIYRYVG